MVTAALTAERPGELYRVDVRTGEELRLTRRNDEFLAELEVRIPERIAFKASDGPGIHGWLLKPAGLPQGAKVPLILQIHGGPHAMYTGVFSHEMQTLAALGYAVLWVNRAEAWGTGRTLPRRAVAISAAETAGICWRPSITRWPHSTSSTRRGWGLAAAATAAS
ncbi:hypothetical protein HMSSN036_30840 [Paenibacillus macerans]|nr:hypothetical protein HMSSN036_30840 [Paenibacillus macerans]